MQKIYWIMVVIFLFPMIVFAADENYRSHFINQSGASGYVLVKTRIWPESGCVIDSGKAVILPGEDTQLVIAKKKECDEAGIGYSFYKVEDKNKEHLLGYVSHRFRDGQFSLQVSVFCVGKQCVFRGLNPEQK